MARHTKHTPKAKTTREREGERIAKERAARHRRQRLSRVFMLGSLSLLAVGTLSVSVWGWQQGWIQNTIDQTNRGFVRMSARSGFVVRNIYLEGRETVPLDAIRNAAAIQMGDPLFNVSVQELKERLQTIPAVRVAHIDRVLPDTLHIHLIERKPIAIWQHKQQLHLIDDDGVVMANAETTGAADGLLQVVGEDAPEHAMDLLKVVTTDAGLFKQIKAAIRVGDRRWNIRFENGIEVKLPENNMAQAWSRLVAMQRAQQVLDRDIVAIDLRLADRVYFKLPATVPAEGGRTARRASET